MYSLFFERVYPTISLLMYFRFFPNKQAIPVPPPMHLNGNVRDQRKLHSVTTTLIAAIEGTLRQYKHPNRHRRASLSALADLRYEQTHYAWLGRTRILIIRICDAYYVPRDLVDKILSYFYPLPSAYVQNHRVEIDNTLIYTESSGSYSINMLGLKKLASVMESISDFSFE